MSKSFIIGTRGSELALWQANYVKNELARIGVSTEIKIIKTQGDRILNLRLDKLEGKGFFTKELEDSLLNGSIDIAVHSHKDLPTKNPEGLIIAAVPEREDPCETLLVAKDCVEIQYPLSIKFGGMVGTSSNRRKAQLLALRPDLEIEVLRGNVPTRIQKLRDEEYDAIMLAKAGVHRLGLDLSDFFIEELSPTEFVPAPAQGALAIQIRESDKELYDVLQHIHHTPTAEEIGIERQVLHLFNGGCHMPLGCYCRKENGLFHVWTSKAHDGEAFPDRVYIQAKSCEKLAKTIVAKFSTDRKFPQKVFITRQLSESSYFRRALEKHGISIEDRSLIRTLPVIHKLNGYVLNQAEWIFFSSKNAVEYFFELKPKLPPNTKFGVIGRGSEAALRRFGCLPDFTGEDEGIDIADIAQNFARVASGGTILFPGAKDSLRTVQSAFSSDTKIIDLPVYETVLEDKILPTFAEVLIFTSPSNVEAYFTDNLLDTGQRVICIGKSTGKKCEELGIDYTLPYSPDEIGLAEAVFGLA